MSLRSNPHESDRGGSGDREGRATGREDGPRSRPEPAPEAHGRDARDETVRVPDWVTDLDAERPYLSSLPAGLEGETLVLDWMAFLRSRAGLEGARDALAYYRAVGWISGDVEDVLADYAVGVGGADGDADGELGTTAHRRSLLFVARLSVARR